MIFTSQIIGEQPNGTPETGDGLPRLGNDISATRILRRPIRAQNYAIASPAVQTVSHVAWNRAVTPASTAAVQALLTRLGRGIWSVTWQFLGLTDWTRALTVNTDDFGMYIAETNGISGNILTVRPLANWAYNLDGIFEVNLPTDNWAIYVLAAATGVAQNSIAEASLICNKLD